jgi:ABC-type multidrug transport system fused ATPase/permease subunit
LNVFSTLHFAANTAEYYSAHRAQAAEQAKTRRQDARSTTLTTKEERQQGEVTTDIYLYYIRAGGAGMFTMMCMFIVLAQASQILSSFWLSFWGESSVNHEEDGNPLSTSRNIWFLNVFAALSCLNLIFYISRSVALADHRMGASVDLHRGLLKATLFAPIAFFDVTPTGRILNRFSSDLQTVDEEISQSVSQGLNSIASVLSAVGAIAGATKGTFLILLLPIAVFYQMIQKFFKATNTSVARLESISRSPIYADFSQALNGMTTIRAYNDAPRFIEGLERCVDANSVANVTQQLAGQWLAIRLDLIGALISFFMAVLAAAAPGFIPPGFLALGLTYSFQLTTYLKFLVRMMAQLEAQLNSVERVKFYMDNIEREGASKQASELAIAEIPEAWPARGEIVCKDVELRYRDGPLVLKGLSFNVAGAEKIGVAGRTGSGKSSLMIGLFRIQELAAGSITIDDIDIATIPLTLLRSKLGIIPQDPVMFSASVRFNLDPFDKHTDAEIWQV